jgi:cytochrome P450
MQYIKELVKKISSQHESAIIPERCTIFDAILNDERLSEKEKTVNRLTDEATILVIAASETPAKVLALIVFYLTGRPDLVSRIRKEIVTVQDTTGKAPLLHELKDMPYLTAVIKEGLRLHGGIVARSQRVCRHETLRYGDFVIPPGTPLSTSSHFIHRSPELFPEPSKFQPERWLDHHGLQVLSRYLVAFGKGTRNCLGKNLGEAELYLTLGSILKRFNFELFDTNEEDVEIGRDWYVMQPRRNGRGIRAIVLEGN